MSLKEEKIIKMINREKIIKDAENLIINDKVKLSVSKNFWKGEVLIKGNVDGYSCSGAVSGDNISTYNCQCGKHLVTKGLCEHLTATFLIYARGGAIKENTMVYTSMEADRILKKCRREALESYLHETDVNNLGLAFEIYSDNNILLVDVHVLEKKRRHHIDDLYEFEENFALGLSAGYRWKISLLHRLDSFKEEYWPMVEFVLSNIRKRKELDKLTEGIRGRIEKDRGKMYLACDEIDRFMQLVYECGGQVVFKYMENRSIHKKNVVLTDNNPEINIKLSMIRNAGYKLQMSGINRVIYGHKRMFVVADEFIYMAAKDYTEDIGEFIYEILRAGRDREYDSYSVTIGKKDMPAFTNLVISKLKKYCKVTAVDIDMDEFDPWDIEATFAIEAGEDGGIVCVPDIRYQGKSVDIFGGIAEYDGICRDYRKEAELKSVILKYFKKNKDKNIYYTEDYRQIFGLIKSGIIELQKYGEVSISKDVLDYKIVDSMKINANVSVDGSWLKLDIDAGDYSMEELEELLHAFSKKEKYIKLSGNKLVRLDDNGLELLAQMAYDLDFSATDIINKQVFVPKYRAMYIDGRLREGNLAAYDKDLAMKALVRTVKQIEDSEFMVPEELEETLRGYQKYGYHWLRTLDVCGFGGILADDMGLGKTLQIITLLLDEKLSVSRNMPSLIIAPATLIYNWENEIKKFAPMLKSLIITGTKENRRKLLESYKEYDVLITSYDLLKRDIDMYENIKFRFQVIDEAQNIKNFSTDNAKCVKKINTQTRFALTGTPIENRLSELWSIFDYLMPGFLYTYNKFKAKFEHPIVTAQDVGAMKGLNRMIKPFVLRRLKKDVLKELPEKQEYDVYTQIQGKQHKLYVANALRLKGIIEDTVESEFGQKKMEFLSELMKLRQICCDPALCFDGYDGDSSKLDMCVDMIKNGIAGGHKILLFSQFTSMLDIISHRLEKEGISFYILTGATDKDKRTKLVEQFNSDETNVFLISLKAGGVGLNLTGADMVIHYDPWWNVAAERQASDRAHRIGQSRVVSVYRIIAKNTIEERIVTLQKSKERLADNILNGETISLGSLSKKELLSILDY